MSRRDLDAVVESVDSPQQNFDITHKYQEVAKMIGHKRFPGDLAHGVKDELGSDSAGNDRLINHVPSKRREVRHSGFLGWVSHGSADIEPVLSR